MQYDLFLELFLDDHASVGNLWDFLKKTVNYCMVKFIPTKNKKTKKDNPWITRDIIHTKRKLGRLRKKAKEQKVPLNRNQISVLNSKLKQEIKNAKQSYLNSTLSHLLELPQTNLGDT